MEDHAAEDWLREEDIFELQHHHLLRCLEKATVGFLSSFFFLLSSLFLFFSFFFIDWDPADWKSRTPSFLFFFCCCCFFLKDAVFVLARRRRDRNIIGSFCGGFSFYVGTLSLSLSLSLVVVVVVVECVEGEPL